MRAFDTTEVDVSREQFWENFWPQYERGGWEPETKAQLERFLSPGSLFVDVGAWIGPVSLWALDLGARVIAIEPDPVAIPELKKRTQGRDVEIWEGALGPYEGTLHLAPGCEFGDTLSYVGNGEGSVDVPCWTLHYILKGRVPNLLKMDVEGYEAQLMPTVGPYLASIGCPILVSLHHVFPVHSWYTGYKTAQMFGAPMVVFT